MFTENSEIMASITEHEQKYYMDENISNLYPFNKLNTCPIFNIPNFGTINWDKTSHENSLKNMKNLDHNEDSYYNKALMYIHVPYCISFCSYCNFARDKYPWKDSTQLDEYTDYLIKEIDNYMKSTYLSSKEFSSIYVGGGSPSTLGYRNIDRLYNHIEKVFPDYSKIETTFTGECKTLKDTDLLKVLVNHNINRLTFGIESLNIKTRKYLGRTDTIEDIESVFNGLKKLNYKGQICVDFMFNHPGQGIDNLTSEIEYLVKKYNPDEIDCYGTIYVPYRPLHKKIIKGLVPQPANINELLKMREYIYNYLLGNGYYNNIAETYSKDNKRSEYQTAHCARQDIIGIGVAARGNMKNFVYINPERVDLWKKNIDNYGVSTQNLQSIGPEGIFKRIMVMWPRYKELGKNLFNSFSDLKSFKKMKNILNYHLDKGVVDELDEKYIVNKLGVIWHPNLQWDYMRSDLNIWGKSMEMFFAVNIRHFDNKYRYKRNIIVKFIDYFTDKYPRFMK